MTEEMIITEPVVEEQKPEPVVEEPVVVTGVIDNCKKLNIRVKPHPASRVVAVLEAGAELIIDEKKSTGGFYKVREANGTVHGFCMKEFVTI